MRGSRLLTLLALTSCARAPAREERPKITSPAPGRSASPSPSFEAVRGPAAPRKLRAALYPFVPRREEMFRAIAREFERRRGGAAELVDVHLLHYYESEKPDSIARAEADVLEIDSAFLHDLDGRIQSLPSSLSLDPEDFTPAARSIGYQNGKWRVAPHWICSNFLFTTKARAPSLTTLAGLRQTMARTLPHGQGLLIDLMGKSTLGELYFDAVMDALGDPARARAASDPARPLASAVEALRDVEALCASDHCRSEQLHAQTGAYARLFANQKGAAFVGYSEELHFFLEETARGCGGGPCLAAGDVAVLPLPLSPHGDHPFAWVDSLAISAGCTGPCLDDAAELIGLMNDDEQLVQHVLPPGSAPTYLLPARVSADARLAPRAPLYPQLRAILKGAAPVAGPKLGDDLRRIGGFIEGRLRPPQ